MHKKPAMDTLAASLAPIVAVDGEYLTASLFICFLSTKAELAVGPAIQR
jgi:hypothetical protein